VSSKAYSKANVESVCDSSPENEPSNTEVGLQDVLGFENILLGFVCFGVIARVRIPSEAVDNWMWDLA
jgi:hypothetical protein